MSIEISMESMEWIAFVRFVVQWKIVFVNIEAGSFTTMSIYYAEHALGVQEIIMHSAVQEFVEIRAYIGYSINSNFYTYATIGLHNTERLAL